MEFKREITINQPIAAVWEVLGNQYSEAYKWAGGLNHSQGYGQPALEGASCNNRACDTTSGKFQEEIRIFDPKNHTLEYEAIEGFPFFVDKAVNNWQLSQLGNQTKVNMRLTVETKGLVGAIMSPMMKMQMNKIIATVLDDLKHYVETGEPSPSKARELARYAKKAA